MTVRKQNWVLNNLYQESLAEHMDQLCLALMNHCPDEFIIQKILCEFSNGDSQNYDVNRRINESNRQEIIQFLHRNEQSLTFFYVRLISFHQRKNPALVLSSTAPFRQLELVGENVSDAMHELMNRTFREELPWYEHAWSYWHNHRPFRHSLTN